MTRGVIIVVLVLVGGAVEAGELRIYNRSNDVTNSSVYLTNIEESIEGYDGEDSTYNSGNPNILHIYSYNPACLPFTDKLLVDSRGPNSTTHFNNELYNNGFAGTADNFLRFRMYDSSHFEWKNMFLGDEDNSEDIVADVKYVIISDGRTYSDGTPYGDFYLQDVDGSETGVYDQRKIMPFNHSDLNRDRKVNGLDFAVFADNFGRTDVVKGSDPNALGDYADLTDTYDVNGVMTSYGDGIVDCQDLGIFVSEWLWDANDPNTW